MVERESNHKGDKMQRLSPRIVNTHIEKYGVKMFRASEGYYYFALIDINNPSIWQDQIESLWVYNLDGYTVERIISHIESFIK